MPYTQTTFDDKTIRSGPFKGKLPSDIKRNCIICSCAIPVAFVGKMRSWRQYATKRFCSRRCFAKWRVGQNASAWKQRPTLKCVECGGIITFPPDRPPSSCRKKYCSLRCRSVHNGGPLPRKENGYVVLGTEHHRSRFEHIQIAEQALGRRLKKGECVHHVNGIRSDNRKCNLLVCSNSYHHWLHHNMGQRYMKEHFGAL